MKTTAIPSSLFARVDADLFVADRSDVEREIGLLPSAVQIIDIRDEVTGGQQLFRRHQVDQCGDEVISWNFRGLGRDLPEVRILND